MWQTATTTPSPPPTIKKEKQKPASGNMNHEIKLFCEADNQSQILRSRILFYIRYIHILLVPVLSARTENDMTDAMAGHRKKYWRIVFIWREWGGSGLETCWSVLFRWMFTLMLAWYCCYFVVYSGTYYSTIAMAQESISDILSDSEHDKKILMKLIILLHVELTVNLICPRRLWKQKIRRRWWRRQQRRRRRQWRQGEPRRG